ncbi:hypothetical protein KC343_g4380 [Hortaea werneckii]|nr:hypothetical protein KC323_g4926 [Hortaea werneckii]KAI6868455.1 hypothetical protein KC338_g3918 [Hortaea werneckii]KAI7259127.1 hypothetical protein KC352_g10490 [Hortaea werneckii]KAI7563681.1 hypothetical protein KC317_g7573 [Hortaea werneckii]KAI7620070.1 hypothetical protein KC346_g4301 [Hortaea werneckii]
MQFFLAALAMSAVAQAAPTNRRDVGSIVDTAVSATQDGTTRLSGQVESIVDGVNTDTLGGTDQQVKNLGNTISKRAVQDITNTLIGATQDGTGRLADQVESIIDGVNTDTLGGTNEQVENLGNLISKRAVQDITNTLIGATQDGTGRLADQVESIIDGVNTDALGATNEQVGNLGNTISKRAVQDVTNTLIGATQDGTDRLSGQVESIIDGVNTDTLGATNEQVSNLGKTVSQPRSVQDITGTLIGATQDGTGRLSDQVESIVDGVNTDTLGATNEQVSNLGETVSSQ